MSGTFRRTIVKSMSGAALVSSISAALPAAYLGVLTVLAAASQLRSSHSTAGGPGRGPSSGGTRFAVCIPAHDEELTIGDAVAALRAQLYAQERYRVYVVADNCSDGTAEVAQRSGAVVHVRDDPDRPGKGPALNWLFSRLDRAAECDPAEDFDVIVVIDADTIAAPDFLEAMDHAFAAGARAAQGYYGVRDPEMSSAVALRYAALACRHHLRPLGRAAVGASSGLYGNGMAFRRDLMTERSWSGHLVEDAEFQLELLLDGVMVTYVPCARVAAEMPGSFDQSVTQHQRWELGRAQLVRHYSARLARRAVKGGPLPRRAYADALADQLVPPLSVVVMVNALAISVAMAAVCVGAQSRRRHAPLFLAVIASGATAAHVLTALRLIRAPAPIYRSLLSAPRAIAWKLVVLGRVAGRPGAVAWTRTARNEKVRP